MSVHVWTPRGLVNHKPILVLESISAEYVITVVSVSDGKSYGDQYVVGSAG